MTAPATASRDSEPLDHAAVRKIVLGILLAMFLGALDQTIVATALATIGRDLADIDNLSWVVTAYLVTTTAVTPLYGKLSDIHGRRAMLLVAIAVFALGSVASALAPTMMVLIIARGVQGLGGGGLLSLAQTIIAEASARVQRSPIQYARRQPFLCVLPHHRTIERGRTGRRTGCAVDAGSVHCRRQAT